ncbi:MAG: hypothetical protein PHE54_02295 [Bacilli bacterium]|nr:hypothetical protein [Bacilli bacterium]
MSNGYLTRLVELPDNNEQIVENIDYTELKLSLIKSLAIFRRMVMPLKEEIANLREKIAEITIKLDNNNQKYSKENENRWLVNRDLLISEVLLLDLKKQEKEAIIELVKSKQKEINGGINSTEYIELRDNLLLSILLCRANIYKTKESIKNFCLKKGIHLNVEWFQKYGIAMYENKRDLNQDDSYNKLLEARDIYDSIYMMSKEQALPKKESEKEFIALKLMATDYIYEIAYRLSNSKVM